MLGARLFSRRSDYCKVAVMATPQTELPVGVGDISLALQSGLPVLLAIGSIAGRPSPLVAAWETQRFRPAAEFATQALSHQFC